MPSTCHFLVIFGMHTANGIRYNHTKNQKHQVRGWGQMGGLNTEILGQNHSTNPYFS